MALETNKALNIMSTLKDLTPILEITSPDHKGFKESTLRKTASVWHRSLYKEPYKMKTKTNSKIQTGFRICQSYFFYLFVCL